MTAVADYVLPMLLVLVNDSALPFWIATIIIIIFLLLFVVFLSASTKPEGLKMVKLDILLPNKIGHCGGKYYVSGKVLLNATALPRWSDTESIW